MLDIVLAYILVKNEKKKLIKEQKKQKQQKNNKRQCDNKIMKENQRNYSSPKVALTNPGILWG